MISKNRKIFAMFFVFSLIISFSHLVLENLDTTMTSEQIIFNNAKKVINEKESIFKNYFLQSENILVATRESKIFKEFLLSDKNKDLVSDLFLTTINSNNNFMQFRYIDESGFEKINVRRKKINTQAILVDENNLQDKSDRYYFIESKKRDANSIWFSKLELNVENKKIEIPYNPTIRAVSPVYVNNIFKGIIIINYFAQNLIDDIVSDSFFLITLADESGYIVSNYDKSKNWGFYKEDKYNINSSYSNDYIDILSNDFFKTETLISKKLDLNLFHKLFIILEVDNKNLEQQKTQEINKEILLAFVFFVFTMLLSFVVIKIFEKLFFDLDEQKHIVDRLELASSIADISLWEFNALSKELIWSKNISSILETNEKIEYLDFLNKIPTKDKKRVQNEFFDSINKKREYSVIHEIIVNENVTKVLEEKGKHFYDSLGRHIKTVGCTLDITEKYLADKLKDEVIKQNKKFERLFNKFDDNVIASTTDLRGVITYTSRAFCEISGYSKEELLGSPQNIVRHPDSPKETFKSLWETIQNGDIWYGEIKNRNKNGTDYWVNAIIYPEYNNDDIVYAYTAIRHDITAQKRLEELHKNIKSSIEVASFIQESIIPKENFLTKCFADKFVIWEPKDIVGGDIYLLERLRNNNECLMMIIDCTGHGVPGAFVTMLIKAIERQIIQLIRSDENLVVNPGEILRLFNIELKEILRQERRNLASNVGFDGGILYYNKKEKLVKYSGAANTLVYYDNKEIKSIKGERHSIGYKNCDINLEFKTHELKVEEGMKFYLFTDGYIDQIGGEKNISFSKKRMIKILDDTKSESMEFQKSILKKELQNYQNNNERIDDVTFIGVQI